MNRFLKYDGPLISFLSRVADLMILNLIYLLCCIPVVTIGAATAAMHYVTLKIVIDNDERGVFKTFFVAFKQNFKQATIIWGIFFGALALFVLDIYIFWNTGVQIPLLIQVLVFVAAFALLIIMMYAFPLVARFENSIKQTLKNAFVMSLLNFIRTLILAAVYISPILFVLWNSGMIPVVILIGFSGTAYANSYLWKDIFKKYVPEDAQE